MFIRMLPKLPWRSKFCRTLGAFVDILTQMLTPMLIQVAHIFVRFITMLALECCNSVGKSFNILFDEIQLHRRRLENYL